MPRKKKIVYTNETIEMEPVIDFLPPPDKLVLREDNSKGDNLVEYWLDLCTVTTWKEFQDAGANVAGFRTRMRKTVSKIKPNDILLSYLTGVMRWVGAFRVLGPSNNQSRIHKVEEFPLRLEVEPIVILDPEYGVPMSELEGKTAFYNDKKDAGKFKAFLRGTPRKFTRRSDGDLILTLLQETEKNPVPRALDPRKLARDPFFKTKQVQGKESKDILVSIPDPDGEIDGNDRAKGSETSIEAMASKHTEIQHHLLSLGIDMGFKVWVARNDRGKIFNGKTLGEIPKMVHSLPTQFSDAVNRTIELIDVLWLKGNSILAAFEVESTTSIYSGLLRMSDLIALQPNLDINLYLVAPEDRRAKVKHEILRPTFDIREKPLAKVCGFIGFSSLISKTEGIRQLGLASSLKSDFLQNLAEYFSVDECPPE